MSTLKNYEKKFSKEKNTYLFICKFSKETSYVQHATRLKRHLMNCSKVTHSWHIKFQNLFKMKPQTRKVIIDSEDGDDTADETPDNRQTDTSKY